jgi:hypothetical protein
MTTFPLAWWPSMWATVRGLAERVQFVDHHPDVAGLEERGEGSEFSRFTTRLTGLPMPPRNCTSAEPRPITAASAGPAGSLRDEP